MWGSESESVEASYPYESCVFSFLILSEADTDNSGLLSFSEIKDLMHSMDPTIPVQEIRSLLSYIDIDEDGLISLDEFKRLFR